MAWVDGEITVKYFRQRQGRIYLEPANKDYSAIKLGDSFSVSGNYYVGSVYRRAIVEVDTEAFVLGGTNGNKSQAAGYEPSILCDPLQPSRFRAAGIMISEIRCGIKTSVPPHSPPGNGTTLTLPAPLPMMVSI